MFPTHYIVGYEHGPLEIEIVHLSHLRQLLLYFTNSTSPGSVPTVAYRMHEAPAVYAVGAENCNRMQEKAY
jgi:hypothetical protein